MLRGDSSHFVFRCFHWVQNGWFSTNRFLRPGKKNHVSVASRISSHPYSKVWFCQVCFVLFRFVLERNRKEKIVRKPKKNAAITCYREAFLSSSMLDTGWKMAICMRAMRNYSNRSGKKWENKANGRKYKIISILIIYLRGENCMNAACRFDSVSWVGKQRKITCEINTFHHAYYNVLYIYSIL